MNLSDYLNRLSIRYQSGIAREHAYRGDLQNLLESLYPEIAVTNELARVACGAPDYILTRKSIPVGYIEAKDIGKPLDHKNYRVQFDRYRNSLPNLIITDYLLFQFYRDGEKRAEVRIGSIVDGSVVAEQESFDHFLALLNEFVITHGQTITSASKLAKMMAGKAKLMANVLAQAVEGDIEDEVDSELHQQFNAFRHILIHDIEPPQFADLYAQTIAYRMFAARLHDRTLEDFSRQEAAELIPKSNPFLRKLFQSIAGPDLDERIDWIVDGLADIFRATDVASILNSFGKSTQRNDPFIHFYETFLAEYDPRLRKSRGVWYTPQPVVNFIVRSVDEILKTTFRIRDGLADSSKTTIKVRTDKPDRRTRSGSRIARGVL